MASSISDPADLTTEQQEIITAAMNDRGQIEMANRADTRGKALRTKKRKFFDENDRQVARRYIESLTQLEHMLFVRETENRGKFELTNFGWLIGRKLQQASKQS